MSIEDDIFANALNAQRLHRTQDMYEPSEYPHQCSMCTDYPTHYRLKRQYVEDLGLETPYIFICKECFNELGVI